jgi:hypothetical protein
MSPVHTYLPTTQPDRRLIQSNGSSKVVMSNDINDFPGGYPGHGSSSYGSDRRSGDRYLGDKLLSQSDNETAPHESEPFESAQPPVASYALRHPGPRLEINRSINTGNDLCIEIRSTNVIRKLTIGSRPLKDASVVLRRKIRAHGQRPPVPLLIQMETGEATEALEWAIRIASGDHPGASELQYAQFVELVHIVWEYKFIVELRGIADFIRITHWRSPGETSGNAFVIGTPVSPRSSPTASHDNPTTLQTTWYEAWMFLASLFGWGDIFQEASREVILDNDCDKFYPAPGRNRLPRILQGLWCLSFPSTDSVLRVNS